MFITGLTLAVLVEFAAVHILGRWQYTVNMLTVPGLYVGLVPIAQMLLLPIAGGSDSERFQSRKNLEFCEGHKFAIKRKCMLAIHHTGPHTADGALTFD
jgi:hypothetical protein